MRKTINLTNDTLNLDEDPTERYHCNVSFKNDFHFFFLAPVSTSMDHPVSNRQCNFMTASSGGRHFPFIRHEEELNQESDNLLREDSTAIDLYSLLWLFQQSMMTSSNEFPTQRPVTRSFGGFSDLRLNERLSKQSWGWWFETPWSSFWRHCNAWIVFPLGEVPMAKWLVTAAVLCLSVP